MSKEIPMPSILIIDENPKLWAKEWKRILKQWKKNPPTIVKASFHSTKPGPNWMFEKIEEMNFGEFAKHVKKQIAAIRRAGKVIKKYESK
jgi:hypothetical protein